MKEDLIRLFFWLLSNCLLFKRVRIYLWAILRTGRKELVLKIGALGEEGEIEKNMLKRELTKLVGVVEK